VTSDLITQVWVPGHPKTKGSLDFYGPGQVEENVKGSKEWRALVADAVKRDIDERFPMAPVAAGAPFVGAVEVMCVFWLDSPVVTHIAGFPIWHGAGDVDKLSRNVLDACAADAKDAAMNGGAFRNDNQVVDLRALKFCASGEPGGSGLLLTVHAVDQGRWRLLRHSVDAARDATRR